tara:strand:+ start:2788 stop:3822 length:1035 start_codon:yes stop_codon:yes gene_type:complete
MSNFYDLKIKNLEKLTDNSIAVTFEVPSELKNNFNFYSGQYVNLEILINGDKVRRSYSICSSPVEGLKIGIKKLEGGLFSSNALKNFKKGKIVKVSTPEGKFYYKSNQNKEILTGIAAGSGITPILSIAKSVLIKNNSNRFRLIYGNKSKSDEMFSNDLIKLKSKFADRFILINIYSRSSEINSLYGRIDDSIINYYMKKYGKANKYFICGPEEMIHNISEKLISSGISKTNIFFELFKTKKIDPLTSDSNTSSTIEIIYEDVVYKIKNPKGKTILDAALDSNIEVPYSCQGGVCSACIAKLISGNINMENNQILTEEEINDGLILTCQSKSKDEYLKISFDDV